MKRHMPTWCMICFGMCGQDDHERLTVSAYAQNGACQDHVAGIVHEVVEVVVDVLVLDGRSWRSFVV